MLTVDVGITIMLLSWYQGPEDIKDLGTLHIYM